MRRTLLLLLVVVAAGCGGSSPPDLSGARADTVAERTAKFTLTIGATVAGQDVQSQENGSIAFSQPRAHLYTLAPGMSIPREIVVRGPYVYANSNLEAAVQDSTVKPWTKLDTRRLSASQRAKQPDELAHVRALAYLADGVAQATTVEGRHLRGRVDPARIDAPAAIAQALRNDYPAKPFIADFWLDDSGRVERVRVHYLTAGGTPITLDGTFSDFGAPVDLTTPPAREIQDISP